MIHNIKYHLIKVADQLWATSFKKDKIKVFFCGWLWLHTSHLASYCRLKNCGLLGYTVYTDKKENQIFLICKEIQS